MQFFAPNSGNPRPNPILIDQEFVARSELIHRRDLLTKCPSNSRSVCLKATRKHKTSVFTQTAYFPYAREYSSNSTKEWTILPYDGKSGVFSDRGDSGSIIVDGCGPIGGGAGNTESSDITYSSPASRRMGSQMRTSTHRLTRHMQALMTPLSL